MLNAPSLWWLLPVAMIVATASLRFAQAYADRILGGAALDARTFADVLLALFRADQRPATAPGPAALCAAILLLVWVPLAALHPGPSAFLRGMACIILLNLALIDARTGFLPDALTLPCLYGGLLVALSGHGVPLHDALAGAVLGYGFLWLFNVIYRHWRGRCGMGGGDMKLLAALGAWLGWVPLPTVLAAACIGGVAYGLCRSGASKWSRPLAFGPFLAAAGAVGLAGPPVVQFLF